MIAYWALAAAAICVVGVQAIVPGIPLYHYGWYNICAIALAGASAWQLRRARRSLSARDAAARAALAGCCIIVIAGVAAGLLGPDTQIIVGSPGTTVQLPGAGAQIEFPLRGQAVHRRYAGALIFSPIPRSVVSVRAADARGNRLTVTQPVGVAFLSPVLLMQRTARIAGMNVRVDGFAIPAMRRSVKAVLFGPQQAAQLRTRPAIAGAAVLFAVSDSADRVVRGGIGIVPSTSERTIGGVRLGATVGDYPAIEVASAPDLPVFVAGLVVFFGAAAAALRTPSHSKT